MPQFTRFMFRSGRSLEVEAAAKTLGLYLNGMVNKASRRAFYKVPSPPFPIFTVVFFDLIILVFKSTVTGIYLFSSSWL